jgi:signal transduction histidine kinase
MSQIKATSINQAPARLGRTAYVTLYLVFAAVAARTLAVEAIRPLLRNYLVLELVFLLLFTAVFVLPRLPAWLLHLYFGFQSILILRLISFHPDFDFLILLYLLLSAQVSIAFTGRSLWLWVGAFVFLSGGSMIYYMGLARGLALSLTTIAAEVIVPAYLIVYSENDVARGRSQELLGELQVANQRLQSYITQVEDLAAIQERNRLARALHDTTSQLVFSISLTARSAQILVKEDPDRLPEQLTQLEQMTGEALAQLRLLITQLRPSQNPEK